MKNKMEEQNKNIIESIYKQIINNSIIKEWCTIKEHHANAGQISYLNQKEQELDEEGRQILGLKSYIKNFELKLSTISMNSLANNYRLEKQFGIDLDAMINNTLINEASRMFDKTLVEYIHEMAEKSHKESYTKWDKFIEKLYNILNSIPLKWVKKFKYVKKTKVKHNKNKTYESYIKIVRYLLSESNKIAHKSRLGPASTIICNGRLATILQNYPEYTFTMENKDIYKSGGAIYPIGQIANIKVFVDPYMKWDDNKVYVFRDNDGSNKSFYFVYNPESSNLVKFKDNNPPYNDRITLELRNTIVFANENLYKNYSLINFDIPNTLS